MAEPHDDDIDGFFSEARVRGREHAVTLGDEAYTDHVFALTDPSLTPWRGLGWREFGASRTDNPFVRALLESWDRLYREPFVGVTTDGVVIEDLYALAPHGRTDSRVVDAARAMLDRLTPSQLEDVSHPLDSPQWRAWSNPEFVIHRVGIRLEDLDERQVDAVLSLIQASLSEDGYARVRETMRLNGFLGELVGLPGAMNERSYFFALYGDPSDASPWGWQLFGHHLALNTVFVGGREVIAPQFIGGEPALVEGRPSLFADREQTAIALASSLTPAQRAEAVVYASVLDTSMPDSRLHPADERHLAGAFRDNRVIPYEGIRAAHLDDGQRALLRAVVADALLLLPAGQRDLTLAEYDAHLDQTWFAWYGAVDGSEPVYFRVQSPVLLTELDNHAGVWLSNRLPARFHVHTTLRLPNGNDYARRYLRQWAHRTVRPRAA